MDLHINRKEIVAAVGEWAEKRLRSEYIVEDVKLDGNGQGATVTTKYLPTVETPSDGERSAAAQLVDDLVLATKVPTTPTAKKGAKK